MASFRTLFNIGKTSFSLIAGQILNFLFIPIIARIFEPEVYGQWAIYFTIITIFGGISTARYSDSIVLLKSDRRVSAMTFLCASIGLVFSVIAVLFCFIFGRYLGFNSNLIYLAPLNVLFLTIHLICQQILIREKKYSLYAMSIFTMSVFPSALHFLGGTFVNASVTTIIVAGFLGQMLSMLMTCFYTKLNFDNTSVRYTLALAKKYSQYPRYSLGFAFFSLLRVRFIYLIFGSYKDPQILAYYAQTDRILNAPSALAGASIRPVFFRYLADFGIEGVGEKVSVLLRLIWLASAPFLALFVYFSEDIILVLLGPKWVGASWFFEVLIIPSFLLLSTNWLDRAYDVLNLQKLVFYMELGYGIVSIVSCSVLILAFENPHLAVSTLAVIFSAYYLNWLLLLLHKMKINLAPVLRSFVVFLIMFTGTLFVLKAYSGSFNSKGLIVGLIVFLQILFCLVFLKRDLHRLK